MVNNKYIELVVKYIFIIFFRDIKVANIFYKYSQALYMHKIPGNFFGMKGVYIASTPIVQEGRKAIVVILKKKAIVIS
jgi:hypothetical protein